MAAVTAAVIGGTAAVAGGVMAFKGAQSAANATDRAAQTQLSVAQQQLNDQKAARTTALSLAQPTAQELAAVDRLVTQNQAQLAQSISEVQKGLSIIDSIDPAIKEAGNQAYDLLKGKQAQLLAPVQAQRSRQRQELEGQLASRLGAGFRTSSAGIEALNKFDTATNEALSQTQQQSLLTLGNFFSGASASRNATQNSVLDVQRTQQAGDQIALNALGNIQNRQVAAWNGAAPTASQAVIAAAGNSYAGQVAQGQNVANLGSAIGNLGAQAVGYGVSQSQATTQFNNQLSALQAAGAFSNMGTAPSSFVGNGAYGANGPTLGNNYTF